MKKTVFALSLFLLLIVPAVHAADMTDLLKALPSIPAGRLRAGCPAPSPRA